MGILRLIAVLLCVVFTSRAALAAENLALRHQLGVLCRSVKRPRIRWHDRVFWVWLVRLWPRWRSALIIAKPETVVRWHREGFRLYWRWKSRHGEIGRPALELEIRDLIRRMSQENPTWGAPRIQAELALLGYEVAESTVDKYIIRQPKPPSPTWRSFLKNHASEIVAIDFFTVPTVAFRILYCFIVLSHDRRRILHFNVTAHPSALWTARQITETFPFNDSPKFIIRDRDNIYGEVFREHVSHMGIEDVPTAYRSPWQNGYVERAIGSIRRECLDHMIILNENHLKRVLDEYVEYYNTVRPHQSLECNSPVPREVEPPEMGKVMAIPHVGGLHHRYTRAA